MECLIDSFRQLPTFGADIIRRFSNNVSELKKLAARDYEDILQVIIHFYEAEQDGTNQLLLSVRHASFRRSTS